MKNNKERIAEIIGEASMCWSETPKGVFDDQKASKLIEELTSLHQQTIEGIVEMVEGMKVGMHNVEKEYFRGRNEALSDLLSSDSLK